MFILRGWGSWEGVGYQRKRLHRARDAANVHHAVDFKNFEHGCRIVLAVRPSFFGLRLEDGHDPTFWSGLSVEF